MTGRRIRRLPLHQPLVMASPACKWENRHGDCSGRYTHPGSTGERVCRCPCHRDGWQTELAIPA